MKEGPEKKGKRKPYLLGGKLGSCLSAQRNLSAGTNQNQVGFAVGVKNSVTTFVKKKHSRIQHQQNRASHVCNTLQSAFNRASLLRWNCLTR